MTDKEKQELLDLIGEPSAPPPSQKPISTLELQEQFKKKLVGPKGSSEFTGEFVSRAAAPAINSLIGSGGNPLGFAALLGTELAGQEIFGQPTAAQSRGEIAGALGGAALDFLTRGKGGALMNTAEAGTDLIRQMFKRGAAEGGAVGLEQAGEVAAGQATPLEAVVNTASLGIAPAALGGLFGGAQKVAGRVLLGKGPDDITQRFVELTGKDITDLGYAAASGKGGLQQLLLITENLPFVEKIRLSRDRRLTEGFFTALENLDFSPDVSINPKSPGVIDRTLKEIGDDVKKAFFAQKTFQDLVEEVPSGPGMLKNVRRLPQAGDIFEMVIDPKKGSFQVLTNAQFGAEPGPLGPNSIPVSLTKESIEGLRMLAKDPGLMAQQIGKSGANIEQVIALRAVLPPEDALRVRNAFVNNFLLGASVIVDSAKGAEINSARGTITRKLAVNAKKFRAAIENFKEEKLLNVLKLGMEGPEEEINKAVERQFKDLSALAEFMERNSVDIRDITKADRFAQYAGNKMLFQIANPGNIGTAATVGGSALLALNGLVSGGIQIASGITVAATAGAMISMALSNPGAMKFMNEMAQGKFSPASAAFMRGLKAEGWDFIKNPENEKEVMMLPPPGPNEAVLQKQTNPIEQMMLQGKML